MLKLTPVFQDIQAFLADCQRHTDTVAESSDGQLKFATCIECSHLHFQYDVNGSSVLIDFSMTVPFGRVTCLTGPSGAGKSTVMDLVCGLLTPQQGEIRVDGVALTAENKHAWQRQIGYVPQDSVFFHDTVRANLFAQDDRFTDAELITALKCSQACSFVEKLPQQLSTVIGPNGVRLSGGERQRLALARALLLRPTLLVLDEATNALDHDTERAFLQSIRALTPAMTVLMISHQPHLSEYADHHIDLQTPCRPQEAVECC